VVSFLKSAGFRSGYSEWFFVLLGLFCGWLPLFLGFHQVFLYSIFYFFTFSSWFLCLDFNKSLGSFSLDFKNAFGFCFHILKYF
jgi:hypothetical protein